MRSGNRSSRLSLLLLFCAAVAIFSASWVSGFPEENNNNDVQDVRKFLIEHHHSHGLRDQNANDHSAHFFEHFPSHGGDGEHERRWGRIRDWRVEHNLDEKKPEPEPEGLLSRIWSYASEFTNPWRPFFHPAGHWEKEPLEQEQEESRGHRLHWRGLGHEHFHGPRPMHGFHHDGPRSFFHRIRDSIWNRPERHAGNFGKGHDGHESAGVLVPIVAKAVDGFFRSTPVEKEPTTTCIGMWEQDVKALVRSLKDALKVQCESESSHNKICGLYKVNPKMAALLAFREAEENPVHVAMMRTSSQEIGDCGEQSVLKGWHLVRTLKRHLLGRMGSYFSPRHNMHEHFMRQMFRRHELEHEHELGEHERHFRHGRFLEHEHEHESKEDEHPFDLRAKLQAIENAHHNVHHDAEHGSKDAKKPWWRLWHAVHASEGDAREHDNAKVCKDCFVKGVHRLTRAIKAELSVMCISADDPELVEACQFAREHRCLTKTYLLSTFPVEKMVTYRCRPESRMINNGHFPPHPHHFGFRMGGHHPFARPFELGVEEGHPHMEVGPHSLFSEHHVMPQFRHWLRVGGCPRHRANEVLRRAIQLRGDENGFPGPLIRTHFIVFKGAQIRPDNMGEIPLGPRRLGPGHFQDVVLKLEEHMNKMAAKAAAASSVESEFVPALEEPKMDETVAKPLRQHKLPAGWKNNPSRNFRISANPNNVRPAAEQVTEPSFLTSLKERARRFRISAKPVPLQDDVKGVEENPVVKDESVKTTESELKKVEESPVVKDESVKATDSEPTKEETVNDHPQVIFPVV